MSNPAQFEQLVRDHQQMVFRTLARLLGPGEHLDDLAQDVFLRLHRGLPAFRGEAQISTYLYRIALNVAQTELARRKRTDRRNVSLFDEGEAWEARLAHPAPNPAQHFEQAEFAATVDAHLQQLSLVERSALLLYHQEERSYQEVATILNLPLNTVRTHLHRARMKLRTALASNKVTS